MEVMTRLIRHVDAPLTVRSLDLGGVACNEAGLDFMELTQRQFSEASLPDLMPTEDLASGHAWLWMRRIRQATAMGGGSYGLRIQAGLVRPVDVAAELLVIDRVVVATFRAAERPTGGAPAPGWGRLLQFPTDHTGRRRAESNAPAASPARAFLRRR